MKRLFILLLFLGLISCVNATVISIDNSFDSKHSLGDVVDLEFSISSQAKGFIESYLKCGSNVLVDKRYEDFDNYTRDFKIEVPFVNSGECRFLVEFDSAEAESDLFEVGGEIKFDYELNNLYFRPGEELIFEGNATKFNGDSYEGEIVFNIGDLIEQKQEIEDGEFFFRYRFREDVSPGEFEIVLSALEKVYEGVENFGEVRKKVFLKSIPYYLEIDSVDEIKPPANFSFSVKLLDQGKSLIENESVVVKLYNPSGKKIYEKSVESGSDVNYEFDGNFSVGKVNVKTYFGSISESKSVYIKENEKLDVFFEEGFLVFVNKGNAPYEGNVNFSIEGEGISDDIFINLSLSLGEEYVYGFKRSGIYDIKGVVGKDFFNKTISDDYSMGAGSSILGAFIGTNINWQKVFVSGIFILVLVGSGIFVFVKRKKFFLRKKEQPIYESSLTPIKVKKSMKKNLFLIFITGENLETYEDFLSTRGLKIRRVNSKEGYVVTFKEDIDRTHHGLINLARQIKELKGVKSIILNSSHLEKDISKVKEFVLFNRDIASRVEGVFVFGDFLKYIDKGKKNFVIDGKRIQGAII